MPDEDFRQYKRPQQNVAQPWGKPGSPANVRAANRMEKIIARAGKRVAEMNLKFKVSPIEIDERRQLSGTGSSRMFKMTPETYFKGIRNEIINRSSFPAWEDDIDIARKLNHPDTFLRHALENPFRRASVANLVRRIMKQLPIDAPMLETRIGEMESVREGLTRGPHKQAESVGNISHEGRHRMAVAKALGIKHVPTKVHVESTQPRPGEFRGRKELRTPKPGRMEQFKNLIAREGRKADELHRTGGLLEPDIFRRIRAIAGKGVALGMALAPGAEDLVDAFVKFPRKAREHAIRKRLGS